jgi:cyclo(L-tyrosyl-L-tyrosyl) synthase
MEFKVKNIEFPSKYYINQDSENTVPTKNHALIGVSPFNSFFSESLLGNLLSWGLKSFNDMHVFIPTKISTYTFLALGYPENRARIKTKKQDSYLTNKVLRAFMSHGFSESEARARIVSLDDLNTNEEYLKIYKRCQDAFEHNLTFRNGCLSTSKWILSDKEKVNSISEDSLNIAVQYFLAELPLFLDTPKILNISSSFFVYKEMPEFLKNIYEKNFLVASNQGFLTINY